MDVETMPDDYERNILSHGIAARHHEQAALFHIRAALQCEAGNHEKEAENTLKALGNEIMANEALQEIIKIQVDEDKR